MRAVALVLLLLVPTASAFPASAGTLQIHYAVDETPLVLAAGALDLEGVVRSGIAVGSSATTRLDTIPLLRILDRTSEPQRVTEVRGATFEVSSGTFLATFEPGTFVTVDLAAPYAVALALPDAPLPSGTATPVPAGFLLSGERLAGTLAWGRGEMTILPVAATVTIRDARGHALPDWDARTINRDTQGGNLDALDHAFTADGAFNGRIGGGLVLGGTDAMAPLILTARPAEEDRFDATLDVLDQAAAPIMGASTGGSPADALDLIGGISGIFNGGIVILRDAAATPGEPKGARFRDEPFEVGAFNIARGEKLTVEWSAGDARIHGEADVVLGAQGFGVEEPTTVWIFPIAALVLWIVAAGALVWFLVRRPPAAKTVWTIRAGSAALYVVVLLVALYLWDRSFTETFGTGVIEIVRAEGVNAQTLPRIGMLGALELAPWGIVALLFALPVRIAAGVALRYLGKGKSYKGLASAAGLVALIAFGPTYALWAFNLVWTRAGIA